MTYLDDSGRYAKEREEAQKQEAHRAVKRFLTEEAPELPDNNPKTAFGMQKLQLHLVPAALIRAAAQAFTEGARKYGAYNWRQKKVSASVYQAAVLRHLTAWFDGEDNDPETGYPHLGHAAACIGILLDAAEQGQLNDDRPVFATPRGAFMAKMALYKPMLADRPIPIMHPYADKREEQRGQSVDMKDTDMAVCPFRDGSAGGMPYFTKEWRPFHDGSQPGTVRQQLRPGDLVRLFTDVRSFLVDTMITADGSRYRLRACAVNEEGFHDSKCVEASEIALVAL